MRRPPQVLVLLERRLVVTPADHELHGNRSATLLRLGRAADARDAAADAIEVLHFIERRVKCVACKA